MRLRGESGRKKVSPKAAELIQAEEGQDYSVKKFFTPEEWRAVEERVFRDIRGLSELQDRYFLFMVTDNPRHSLSPHAEELFQKTKVFLEDVITKSNQEKALTRHNFSQALHVATFLSRAFPQRKQELPMLAQIKKLARETPEELFTVLFGAPIKVPSDICIVLVKLGNYLSVFPEDKPWIMKEAKARLPVSVVQKALNQLEGSQDWGGYLQLGAAAKLVYPEEIQTSHTSEIWDDLKTKTYEPFVLYTRLPDLLNFRILTSEKTTISPTGALEIEDGGNPVSPTTPLPERLVA